MRKETMYVLLVVLLLVVAGCKPAADSGASTPNPTLDPAAGEPAELEHVDLGVGYVPNVQFAPFYVADHKGFFAEEGLEVSLEHGFENDFVVLTGQGKRQFSVASGDRVIVARAQGLPVVYVMKWYQRFPVGVMSLAQTGIQTPGQLEGHSIGFPGSYGSSYTGWKALESATGLDPDTIQLESIGYTAAEAVSQGQVDAAVVYITNEPIQLEHSGQQVNVFEVSDYANIVSNGIIANETVIREQPDLVRRLLKAFLKGVAYTIDHPDEAFEISRQYVPEISDDNAPIQREVLEASIVLWRSETPGTTALPAWQETMGVLLDAELIESPLDLNKVYTNEFVE